MPRSLLLIVVLAACSIPARVAHGQAAVPVTARDEAQQKNWTVVDMKSDWKRIFP